MECDGCKDCESCNPEIKVTCKGLLQKAYEVVKRYKEMEGEAMRKLWFIGGGSMVYEVYYERKPGMWERYFLDIENAR